MKNNKYYSEETCKKATELDDDETMDEDEDEYRTKNEDKDMAKDEDERVTEYEDEFRLVTEDKDELELVTEDEDELMSEDGDEPAAEDEDEPAAEDEDEPVAGDEDEPVTEDEDEPVAEGKDEPRAENENEVRANVPIQRSKRGTRSIKSQKSRSGNEGGVLVSAVWEHFDTKTTKYPGRPVCQKCKPVFSNGSGTFTLRRHLSSHRITAPKRYQKTMHDYRTDPHSKNEQEERDKLVANWVICDLQPFTIVECEEW